MQFELNAKIKHQNDWFFFKYLHHVLSIVGASHYHYINGMDALQLDPSGGKVGRFSSVSLVEAGGSRADEKDLYEVQLLSEGARVRRGSGPGSPCPSAPRQSRSRALAPCPGQAAPGAPAWSPRQLRSCRTAAPSQMLPCSWALIRWRFPPHKGVGNFAWFPCQKCVAIGWELGGAMWPNGT